MKKNKKYQKRKTMMRKSKKNNKKRMTKKKSLSKKKMNKKMKGGYGPGAHPVGYGWTGNINTWPGVNVGNVPGATVSNYYPLSKNGIPVGLLDPALSSRNQMIGGGWRDYVPKDVINSYRGTIGEGGLLANTYTGFIGRPSHASPYPVDQPIDVNVRYVGNDIVDVPKIHSQSEAAVSKM